MTVLVTGATGNIGRRVVDRLIELGAADIRALTTSPDKAALPSGVTTITGYLGRPESLPDALAGVDSVYLAPLPSTVEITLKLMRDAGVQYVVALSGGAHWQEHSDAVSASGIPNTQLGPGEFLENFSIWAPQIKAGGVVREPYPDVTEAPVSMDDIASVAASLLVRRDATHLGRSYELTGPESLTRAQIAQQIGIGAGVDVTFEQCSHVEALQILTDVMGDGAQWYLDLLAANTQAPQRANDLVAQLTGTPAMSVAQWAAANADAFR